MGRYSGLRPYIGRLSQRIRAMKAKAKRPELASPTSQQPGPVGRRKGSTKQLTPAKENGREGLLKANRHEPQHPRQSRDAAEALP